MVLLTGNVGGWLEVSADMMINLGEVDYSDEIDHEVFR